MNVEMLVPILDRFNKDFKGEVIDEIEIDFFLIAPAKTEQGQFIDRYWSGVYNGVPIDELQRSISKVNCTIYGVYRRGGREEFEEIDNDLISKVAGSILKERFILYLGTKRKLETKLNSVLDVALTNACSGIYGTVRNGQYLPERYNEHHVLNIVYAYWRKKTDFFLEFPVTNPNVSLNIEGISIPVPENLHAYAQKLFQEIDGEHLFQPVPLEGLFLF